MKTNEIIYKLIFNGTGRHTTRKNEDEVFRSFMQTWNEVKEIFSNFTIEAQDYSIDFTIDWEPILQITRYESIINSMINDRNFEELKLIPPDLIIMEKSIYPDVYFEIETGKYARLAPDWNKATITCKARAHKEFMSEEIARRQIGHYLENFLYQLFIIMNIASPGSINLHKIILDAGQPIEYEINLDGNLFEYAYEISYINNWPKINFIPLIKVWEWYNSLNIKTKQVASNRIERALFSLLNYSSEDTDNPMIFIWLTSTLEALYDLPTSLINKLLKERIYLFLEIPKENSKKLRNEIDNIYNVRSRIAHGEYSVYHPSLNDLFDSKVIDHIMALSDTSAFCLSIILATLQKLIVNNWKEIKFEENIKGVN